ncbi:T9SS type A sorting domain-containing protein [Flavitalea sp. BT771]|uniref:T9SS type A sorting domain-containing protein n=1 Tax=Flavitalea sp. BT771 TaxID=3063329 RepID=UPI0026E21C29|nr:T9SS type A sorting domain-containing protein [Flavitalea sp. BT771]MDO6433334.1 T9SS type A sorting domain-containing protein [Flavitalea sp. BT771]MDV6222761.1 T9SS type A sorting domain-containing protein [Flavitalea sp. BT771]
MKHLYPAFQLRYYSSLVLLVALVAANSNTADAQSCPLNTNQSISTYPNTFYPANQTYVNAGSTSISLGSVTYGVTPISSGDVLLVIQMQGSQINSANTSSYGDGSGSGRGYLNNSALLAGRMEFVVAANSVPLTGGTLNLVSAIGSSFQNTAFGTDGQYTYQVIRVPLYYDVTLAANIAAPRWNGTSGGVIALYATHNINMAGFTIDASGLGFRGGGGRAFSGSGTGSNADFITPATSNANGGKGEGIAGTPKYLNNNNTFLDVSSFEGYPNGSYGKGAPGNAGGGGTDGNPASNNDENTGGGGGGNAGLGGNGGNAWNSGVTSGGKPGATFGQGSPSRLIMGGGGGAGTTNNGTGSPGSGFASSGSAGGGIVILSANAITGSGTIKANGGSANISVKNDGSGGGGAGGSILIYSKTGSLTALTVTAKGGNGGSNQMTGGASHGPGGGGGGGVIYSNMTLGGSSSVAGGSAGTTNGNTINYGATAGGVGTLSQTITQSQTPVFPISCVVLSVEFLDIAAVQNNDVNTITWQVSHEINTLEYVVEKSTDGRSFRDIGHVAYQPGASSGKQYTFNDNEGITGAGAVYYRIRQTEASGENQYSKVVSLQMNGKTSTLTVFPNPARSSATVTFVAASNADVSLRLFDLKGSQVWQKQTRVSAGANAILLDQLGTIPNGIYLLQWFDGLKPQQLKLLVNH